MCVCVCVCVYVYMYLYVTLYMFSFLYVCALNERRRANACMSTQVLARTCLHTYKRACLHAPASYIIKRKHSDVIVHESEGKKTL